MRCKYDAVRKIIGEICYIHPFRIIFYYFFEHGKILAVILKDEEVFTMKMSKMFVQTLREFPSDAEVVSHKMLARAGFIKKLTSGVYNYMPLMWRVLKKIENIVREEMDKAGAQELLMPFVQPKELWDESGRWDAYGI